MAKDEGLGFMEEVQKLSAQAEWSVEETLTLILILTRTLTLILIPTLILTLITTVMMSGEVFMRYMCRGPSTCQYVPMLKLWLRLQLGSSLY